MSTKEVLAKYRYSPTQFSSLAFRFVGLEENVFHGIKNSW